MKQDLMFVGVFAFLSSIVVLAQAPQPPKPSPEHQKLQAFAGNWTYDGEAKPSPFGPGGKVAGTDRIESLGGFFIHRSFQEKGPFGERKGVHILGYDAAKKTYIQSGYDSLGGSWSGTAAVNGNNWTLTQTVVVGGKSIQQRCNVAFATGNVSYTVKCETSPDGKTWTAEYEAKGTKSR